MPQTECNSVVESKERETDKFLLEMYFARYIVSYLLMVHDLPKHAFPSPDKKKGNKKVVTLPMQD